MPEPLPTVSLVILNWNGRSHLEAGLRSLAELDYPSDRLELIVVDNGSDDGSARFVRESYPNVKVIALAENHGFAEPNNLAASEASGDWIGFLNNDMRVGPSWLRDILSTLEEHPQAACIGSRIMSWDGTAIDFIGGGVSFDGHGFQIESGESSSPRDVERPVLFACGGAMLVRQDVYKAAGGFDADFFAYFEDVDLGWRLNLLGHDVWYTPRATAFHRHHSTGRRLPPHQLRVLYERNALYTIYKCWDDDNLAAALPAALMLLNERALIMAELNTLKYHLAPSTPSETRAEKPQFQRLYAYDPAAQFDEPLPSRARRVLRQEGIGSAAQKTGRYLRFRAERLRRRLLSGGRNQLLPWASVSHYVALSEFARNLEGLNRKREWLQQRRRRSDAELLPLLEDPFFAGYSDKQYERFHSWLCAVQGLDRRFDPGSPVEARAAR